MAKRVREAENYGDNQNLCWIIFYELENKKTSNEIFPCGVCQTKRTMQWRPSCKINIFVDCL